jgi:hypothetical protein
VSGLRPEHPDIREAHLALDLDTFTAQALHHESDRLGVSREQLALFAIAYYLADLDSGRTARRIISRPTLGE